MEQKKKRKPEASCLVTVTEKPLYFFKHALKLVFQLIWFLLQKCAASEKEWSWRVAHSYATVSQSAGYFT